MLNWLRRRIVKKSNPEAVFDQYVYEPPTHQNAIDTLPGWNSAFPPKFELIAGAHHLYADDRVLWALEQYGAIEGKVILEVGPLEGMHTYLLNEGRPAEIDAIEANKLSFLRCLVSKQILDIDRAKFYLGDIQEWLEKNEKTYDFAVASGVLYHMADPAEFLLRLSQRADALFLWTHFFDDEAMPIGDVRRAPFTERVENRMIAGVSVRYYERSYQLANTNVSFCGGMQDRHYWMCREDILALLHHVGYRHVAVHRVEPAHSGGPCFCVFARK